MKRIGPLGVSALLVMLLSGGNGWGMAAKESILTSPIIDGESLAGVKIGGHESDIYRVLGFPDEMQPIPRSHSKEPPGALKYLAYHIGDGEALLIITRDQKVESISLAILIEKSTIRYRGKSRKGIGLWDTVEEMKKRYGESDRKDILWYKKAGIAFGADDKGRIQSIQIVSPDFDWEKLSGSRP